MVATDSYRLSVKETTLESPLQGSLEANVPARALQELVRIAQQAPGDTLAVSVGQNQVIFEVLKSANKIQIKGAIEALFKVGVIDVNTLVMRGKDKRMGRGYSKLRNWKKAIVTLKAGDAIQFFDEKAE